MPQDGTQLNEQDRVKLDGIVQKMIENKESDEDIQFVVNDFKQKYGKKKVESTPLPLQSPSVSGTSQSEAGSLAQQNQSYQTWGEMYNQANPQQTTPPLLPGAKAAQTQPEIVKDKTGQVVPPSSVEVVDGVPMFTNFSKPTDQKQQPLMAATSSGETTAKDQLNLDPNIRQKEELSPVMTGIASLGSGLSKTPALLWDAGAYLNNIVSEKIGITPKIATSQQISDTFGVNIFAKEIDDAVANYNKEKARRYDKDLQQYFTSGKEGDFMKGLEVVAMNVGEALPTTLALALSGGTAGAAATFAGGSAMFAAQKKSDLDKENPNLTEGEKLAISATSGLMESASESLFGAVKYIGGPIASIFKSRGKDAAMKAAKEAIEMSYGKAFAKYFGSSAEEVISEVANQFGQNVLDKYSGVDPNRDLKKGLFDAAVTAIGMSKTVGSPVLMGDLAASSKKAKEEAAKILEQKQILQKDLESPNTSDAAKNQINNQMKDLNQKEYELTKEERAKYDALTPENKSQVDAINKQIKDNSTALADPNISDESRVIIEKRNEELFDQVDGIYKNNKPAEVKTEEVKTQVAPVVTLTEQEKEELDTLTVYKEEGLFDEYPGSEQRYNELVSKQQTVTESTIQEQGQTVAQETTAVQETPATMAQEQAITTETPAQAKETTTVTPVESEIKNYFKEAEKNPSIIEKIPTNPEVEIEGPTIGDRKGLPRKMVRENGVWKQKVGNETTEVSAYDQKKAQEAYDRLPFDQATQEQVNFDNQVFEEKNSPEVQQELSVEDDVDVPRYSRNVSILITPSTVRNKDAKTGRIKELALKYDELFRRIQKDPTDRKLSNLRKIEAQILEDVKKEIIDRVSKIKGAAVMFADNNIGKWDVYEPSFNMSLRVSEDTDTKALSDLLFDLGEDYSQDSFIIEMVSELDGPVRRGEVDIPLNDNIEGDEYYVHYPQSVLTFVNKPTAKEIAEFTKALEDKGIKSFSLNEKNAIISIMPELDDNQKLLPLQEQRKIKEDEYKKSIRSIAEAWAKISGSDVTHDIRVRKSRYQGATNASDQSAVTRQYDRSDLFEEAQKGLKKYQKLGKELAALRAKQIRLEEKGHAMDKKDLDRLNELKDQVLPIIEDTFAAKKNFFLEAGDQLKEIIDGVVKTEKGSFSSPINYKSPARAAVKTYNWYDSDTEKIGDAVRINLIVDTIDDVKSAFDKIVDHKYNVLKNKSNDDKLRDISSPTSLGFNKNLIEIQLPNGSYSEVQVTALSDLIAKESPVNAYPNDQKKIDKRLGEIRSKIGWNIPEGQGHVFYELMRDENVQKEIKAIIPDLSKNYYQMMANPENPSMTKDEYTKEITKLVDIVENADKRNWDKGNKGKFPESTYKFIEESKNEKAEITNTEKQETKQTKDGKQKAAGNRLFNEPIQGIKTIADKYYQRVFGKARPEYDGKEAFDQERAKKIAKAYADMKHDPNNKDVKAAYEALAKETIDQYNELIEAGYEIEINNDEPYNNSQELIDDVSKNKRIKIFSTESGFGESEITDQQRKENPMLADSGFVDVNGNKLLVNDVFRAVHDLIGHGELGNSFGPKGEEIAYQVHARMFSPLARKALATETRGQNSFVNFSGINEEVKPLVEKARKLREEGKEEEAKKVAAEIIEKLSFADQKIGLLPDEFINIEEEKPIKQDKDAVKTRKVTESDQQQREKGDEGREATKTGRSDSTVKSRKVEEKVTPKKEVPEEEVPAQPKKSKIEYEIIDEEEQADTEKQDDEAVVKKFYDDIESFKQQPDTRTKELKFIGTLSRVWKAKQEGKIKGTTYTEMKNAVKAQLAAQYTKTMKQYEAKMKVSEIMEKVKDKLLGEGYKNITLSSVSPITPQTIADLIDLTTKIIHKGIDAGFNIADATSQALEKIKKIPLYKKLVDKNELNEKEFAKLVDTSIREKLKKVKEDAGEPDIFDGKKERKTVTRMKESKDFVSILDKMGNDEKTYNVINKKKVSDHIDEVLREFQSNGMIEDLAVEMLKGNNPFYSPIQEIAKGKLVDRLRMIAEKEGNDMQKDAINQLAADLAADRVKNVTAAAQSISLESIMAESLPLSKEGLKQHVSAVMSTVQDTHMSEQQKNDVSTMTNDIKSLLLTPEGKAAIEEAAEQKINDIAEKTKGKEWVDKVDNDLDNLKIDLEDC